MPAAIFMIWYGVERTLSIHTIVTRRRELFYWAAILCTFALGTVAGDLATEALNLGFTLGVIVFGLLIAVVAAAYYLGVDAVLTFWLAYILIRPLGASLDDLLSQSQANGGVGLGTIVTSVVFLVVISILVLHLSLSQSWPPILMPPTGVASFELPTWHYCASALVTCTPRPDLLPFADVYRSRPEPELAARHPAARELPPHQGTARKHTLCNLSNWSPVHAERLRCALKGGNRHPRRA
jgi:hypothetical protein